jgi:hypothetical protein
MIGPVPPRDYPERVNVIPLHRGAAPIPAANLRAIFEPRVNQLASARLGEAIQTPPPPQRHTLFDAAVDALADFLANVCERPATAIALVAIGMLSVIVPAICWGVLR